MSGFNTKRVDELAAAEETKYCDFCGQPYDDPDDTTGLCPECRED